MTTPFDADPGPGLRRGLNLGGWLSQCERSPEHVAGFVTVDDLAEIAGWGFDHVRVPLDWSFVMDDDTSGPPRREAVEVLRRCTEDAADLGLHCVLDLHVAPVHTFESRTNPLWSAGTTTAAASAASVIAGFWDQLLARLPVTEHLVIDVLNEPSTTDAGLWSQLAGDIVQRIRQRAPGLRIILEGPDRASPAHWSRMEVPDRGCILGVHLYEPLAFTHQQAFWSDVLPYSDREQFYPGRLTPSAGPVPAEFADNFRGEWGRDRLRVGLRPALDRAAELGVPVHCGEFGVFVAAPPAARYAWLRDVLALFGEAGVGWCYWTYRDMGFGVRYDNPLDDWSGQPEYIDGLDPVLLDLLTSAPVGSA